MTRTLDRFDHDAWRVALATGVGYALVLLVVFFVLFLVPYVAAL